MKNEAIILMDLIVPQKFEPIVHFGYQIYMTIALLIVPLVAMTVLYGNVIYTLSSGIRMDIAAISGTESKYYYLIFK
uniref:Uncharacterized protein n=1 Tax=Meloidogyne incognita TaxID=6306 RepID=A0A914NEC0_MELIC